MQSWEARLIGPRLRPDVAPPDQKDGDARHLAKGIDQFGLDSKEYLPGRRRDMIDAEPGHAARQQQADLLREKDSFGPRGPPVGDQNPDSIAIAVDYWPPEEARQALVLESHRLLTRGFAPKDRRW